MLGQEMYKWSDQIIYKGKVAFPPFEDYEKFRSGKKFDLTLAVL